MTQRLMYSEHLIYVEGRHTMLSTRLLYKTEVQQADDIPASLAYLNYLLQEN